MYVQVHRRILFYFGSALNGLEGRLRRHLRREKKLHWHIDYLAALPRVIDIWRTEEEARRECEGAGSALGVIGVSIPIPKFGASDCRCISHLMYVESLAAGVLVRKALEPHPSQGPHPGIEVAHFLTYALKRVARSWNGVSARMNLGTVCPSWEFTPAEN